MSGIGYGTFMSGLAIVAVGLGISSYNDARFDEEAGPVAKVALVDAGYTTFGKLSISSAFYAKAQSAKDPSYAGSLTGRYVYYSAQKPTGGFEKVTVMCTKVDKGPMTAKIIGNTP